jgi:hypothetical protein
MSKTTKITAGLINILGSQWKVVLRDFEQMPDGEASNLYGYCDADRFEIHVNALKTDRSHADTLLHEVQHAIEKMLALDVSEETIRALATGLRQFFVSNPKVARWLTQ